MSILNMALLSIVLAVAHSSGATTATEPRVLNPLGISLGCEQHASRFGSV